MSASNPPRKTATLAVACLGLFLVLLDSTIITNALPPIQADLDASLSGLAWVVDSYTLPYAVLLLLAGTLGDRYGRKRVFQLGLLVFAIGSVACALAPDLTVLNVGRAVQGVGGAAMTTGGLSLVVNAYTDPRERTKAVGAYASLGGIALSAGPLLGGILTDSFDWRWIFWVNLPFTAVGLLLGASLLTESRNSGKARFDLLGQVSAIAGLTLLTYALIEGNNKGWTSPLILGCLAGSVVVLGLFLLVEKRAEDPMMPLELYRSRPFSTATAATVVIGFSMVAATFFFAQYFQAVVGWSSTRSGLATLPLTVAVALLSPVASRMANDRGLRLPVALGSLLAGVGLLSLVSLTPTSSYWVVGAQMALFGVGCGLMIAPLGAAVVMSVPPWRAGLASGINNTSRQVGAVFGVAVLGTLVQHRFTGNVTDRLAALPLGSVRDAVAGELIARGNAGGPPPALVPPALRGAVHAATGTAFTDALHLAFLVAGVTMLVIVPFCWAWLKVSRPAAPPAPPAAPPAPPVEPEYEDGPPRRAGFTVAPPPMAVRYRLSPEPGAAGFSWFG